MSVDDFDLCRYKESMVGIRQRGNPNMQKGKPSVNRNGRAGKTPRQPERINVLGQLMAGYRLGARQRGIAFDLTDGEFALLIAMDCSYCGLPPSLIVKRAFGSVAYTGIDRVDNERGYTVGNCVPCCKQCNYAKRKMPASEFLAWAERLVAYQRRRAIESTA